MHDKEIFDEPDGWNSKELKESPLIQDFDVIWEGLKNRYKTELSALAYKPIPDDRDIARSFREIINFIK